MNQLWPRDLNRTDLVAREREAVGSKSIANVPWARGLLLREKMDSLVDAAQSAADRALEESGAIQPRSEPRVRLLKLASCLGATIRFIDHININRNQIDKGAMRNLMRGTIGQSSAGEWIIHASRNHEFDSRWQVAHELAHALLYTNGKNVDRLLWQRAHTTALEETYCDYVARLILMPGSQLDLPDARVENLAEYLVQTVVRPFRVPMRVAASRWFDVGLESRREVVAVMQWRQYHPFDPMLALSVIRRYGLSSSCRELSSEMSRQLGELSFSEAMLVWSNISGNDKSGLLPGLLESHKDFKVIVSTIRAQYPIACKEIERISTMLFQDDGLAMTFRPEWVVWAQSENACYVPCRKGSPRPDSVVSKVAVSKDPMSLVSDESVGIGKFRGNFRVHAYGHGNASQGQRYILTMLEKIEA